MIDFFIIYQYQGRKLITNENTNKPYPVKVSEERLFHMFL